MLLFGKELQSSCLYSTLSFSFTKNLLFVSDTFNATDYRVNYKVVTLLVIHSGMVYQRRLRTGHQLNHHLIEELNSFQNTEIN